MKTSDNGIKILGKFEGIELEAYLDSGNLWTIGIGTTKVNGVPVKEGDTCTLVEAIQYMKKDLYRFETKVNRDLKVPVSQMQFDMLVCLYYNTGGSRTIIAMINSNTPLDEIHHWWITHYLTAKGKESKILLGRRIKEADLFIS